MISVVLVFLLVLFSMGVSNLVTAAIRQASSVNRSNEAYFAAEGAIEQGLLQNVGKSAGYTTGDTALTGFCDPTKGVCPTAKFQIQGKVPGGSAKIGTEYVVPSPGTGNVGADCNPLTKVTSGYFSYSATKEPHYVLGTTAPSGYIGPFTAIDHPCNWNKIKVGETVAIPLYTTDVSTGGASPAGTETIKNPIDINLQKLKIKFRTACKTGEVCQASGRYKLDVTKGDPYTLCNSASSYLCGDVIVSWQIVGANSTGDKIYTLVADNDIKKTISPTDPFARDKTNSEIYESLINFAATGGLTDPAFIPGFICDANCVLYADYATVPLGLKQRLGKDLNNVTNVSIIDFLRNEGPYAATSNPLFRSTSDKINKPVLKLTIVHSLAEFSTAYSIPYLEYQITTDVGVSGSFDPADAAQTIRAEGQSGPFKQVLEVKQPQETGLLEYVIQQ